MLNLNVECQSGPVLALRERAKTGLVPKLIFGGVGTPKWCRLFRLRDEFGSHFRMTKNTFEVLAQELSATGASPHRKSFSNKTSKTN